jgi:hypothetical protein
MLAQSSSKELIGKPTWDRSQTKNFNRLCHLSLSTSYNSPLSTVRVPPPWRIRSHPRPYLQIKYLETDMPIAFAMLRRRINSQESPIYRLPPELFSHIASHLKTDDLVEATHVSCCWRTVLLTHPNLWPTLDFTDPQRVSNFLTRSKSATIHVFLPEAISIAPLLDLVEKSAERIAALRVCNYILQKEPLLRKMPSLGTLEFQTHHGDGVLNEETRLSFPVLKTLFFYGADFSVLCASPNSVQVHSLGVCNVSDGWVTGFLAQLPSTRRTRNLPCQRLILHQTSPRFRPPPSSSCLHPLRKHEVLPPSVSKCTRIPSASGPGLSR